jgi:predicted Zn-dependent protease
MIQANGVAENSLKQVLAVEPGNMQYLSAPARLYLVEKQYDKAADRSAGSCLNIFIK